MENKKVPFAGLNVGFLDNPYRDGLCISIFVAGCDIRCEGCHNKELWEVNDFPFLFYEDILDRVCRIIDNAPIRAVAFMGGEPLLYPDFVSFISESIKKLYKDIKIILYTGYNKTKEDIENISKYIDMAIVGPYIENQRQEGVPASANQQIIYF